MIDKATVQRIKDASDIVEVVSDYVHLTRRGSNYMGLCPFHNERTPSFSVNPRRNFCYCFSCHKGGSPVNFIMEKEGVSYHDALLHLAKKYGIKVEERELTDEERQLATEREGLMVASEWAMKQMESDLLSTEEGRTIGLSYLYHRGVTEDAIRKFHLGYAIDRGNHLTDLMQRQGFDTDVLRKLGLTGQSQSGNLYDKYRGRVIFPIMNSSGKVVGFGGRDLKGAPAKYINSPESVLYHKNNELYGIFQAKSEIVRRDHCFLVEGYLDVISMWMSGMENTVASSGTALTDGQIALIHRFTSNITVLYDGDSAGIKAALRGIDMLLLHKMKVRALLLPDGDDPDSFAKKHTPEEFREYVKANEMDIIRFKMQVLMQGMSDDPRERATVINSVVRSIACISEEVERLLYVKECSRMLKIDEMSVAKAVERARFEVIENQKTERRRRLAAEQFQLGQSANQVSPADGVANSQAFANAANAGQSGIENATSDNGADNRAGNGAQNGGNNGASSGNSLSTTPGQSQGAAPENAAESQEKRDISLIERDIIRGRKAAEYPMRGVEERMLQFCVRYGFLPYVEDKKKGDSEEERKQKEETPPKPDAEAEVYKEKEVFTIVDFVNEELEADELTFSVPEYAEVYKALLEEVDEFVDCLNEFKDNLAAEIREARVKGREEIASRGMELTIAKIEREERLLEERLVEEVKQRLTTFAQDFPGNFLASHENGVLRNVANVMLHEKHILSALYSKNKSRTTSEESISQQVGRAMMEWKCEVLEMRIRQGQRKIARYSESDDVAQLNELLHKQMRMMALRQRFAEIIGERILSARTGALAPGTPDDDPD